MNGINLIIVSLKGLECAVCVMCFISWTNNSMSDELIKHINKMAMTNMYVYVLLTSSNSSYPKA